jgi:hypothetical protein
MNNVTASQILGDLLNLLSDDEHMDSVDTDQAYDTKQFRQTFAD